jgi:hypothetical protein
VLRGSISLVATISTVDEVCAALSPSR